MADLSTTWLGLRLANPLVPSASPLSRDTDHALRLEDAGAAALVMYSLFEEKIDREAAHLQRFLHEQETGFAEATGFHPVPDHYKTCQEEYLEQLAALKARLAIPVIASLNGTSLGGWIEYGRMLEEAGADALELNTYHLAANPDEDCATTEQRYLDLLRELRRHVRLPINMKISPYFSALAHFAKRLETAGANGLSLFNRFYQPDIDLDTLDVAHRLELSRPHESLLRIRWAALLHGKVNLSLGVTGGFHTGADALKALLAGADVVHLCSVLLQEGPAALARILDFLQTWMTAREYASVAQLRGSLSQQHAMDPAAYERANYVEVLDSYSSPPGVWR